MNLEFAEIIAQISMLSVILPLIIGSIFIRKLSSIYKIILASLVVSLAFDAFSLMAINYDWNFLSISNYYDLFAISLWGLVFRFILKKNSIQSIILDFSIILLLVFAGWLTIARSAALFPSHSSATLGSLFILAGSTGLIMYFLIQKKEIEKSDIPIIIILSANIIYYATTTSIFVFFSSLPQEQTLNLYLIKWVLYILLHIVFAYTFFYLGRGKWDSA